VNDSKIRSRLKAQLTKFSSELCKGLTKPLAGFVSEMLFGIQSSQDVKLRNISRALQEEVALIRTEKRLSRNLKRAELEKELTPQSDTPRGAGGLMSPAGIRARVDTEPRSAKQFR
jgi:hypothetical protein